MGEVKKILVVDDDATLLEMLKSTLIGAGHLVTTALNGTDALKMFKTVLPEIVITDLYMPGNDGMEVLMGLRKNFPRVKIVAISGGVGKDNLLRVATKLGAAATIQKPFTPEELLGAVRQVAA